MARPCKVNEAVRDELKLGPLRPTGSEDLYGVPNAVATPCDTRTRTEDDARKNAIESVSRRATMLKKF